MFYRPRSKGLLAIVIMVMLFFQYLNYSSIHSKFLYCFTEAIKYWGDSTQYGKIGNKHPNDGFGERTMGYGFKIGNDMIQSILGPWDRYTTFGHAMIQLFIGLPLLAIWGFTIGLAWCLFWMAGILILGMLIEATKIHIFPTLITLILAYWPGYTLALIGIVTMTDPLKKLDDIARSGKLPSVLVSQTLLVHFEMMIAKLNAERRKYE